MRCYILECLQGSSSDVVINMGLAGIAAGTKLAVKGRRPGNRSVKNVPINNVTAELTASECLLCCGP